jgi:hypothetical protein
VRDRFESQIMAVSEGVRIVDGTATTEVGSGIEYATMTNQVDLSGFALGVVDVGTGGPESGPDRWLRNPPESSSRGSLRCLLCALLVPARKGFRPQIPELLRTDAQSLGQLSANLHRRIDVALLYLG